MEATLDRLDVISACPSMDLRSFISHRCLELDSRECQKKGLGLLANDSDLQVNCYMVIDGHESPRK